MKTKLNRYAIEALIALASLAVALPITFVLAPYLPGTEVTLLVALVASFVLARDAIKWAVRYD